MNLVVNGVPYTNFKSASCTLRLDSLADQFEFTATAPGAAALPFKGRESCSVSIGGDTVLTGHIEVVSVSYSNEEHTIVVRGRSNTGDLLDSTLDEVDDLSGDGLTLKGLAEKVIKSISLSLSVVDEVSPEAFNGAEDIAAPESGDSAFKFLEKYARKRQVLLTCNGAGNLVIASNSGLNADGRIQHIVGANDNNVLSCSYSYDTTGRYNVYKMASSLNPVALNLAGATDLASLVDQSGRVSDPEIRPGRVLVLTSETPFSDGSCDARAKWELNVRRARGLVYSATVQGWRVGGDTGDLWAVNRVYQIVDEFVGKIEPMLCNSVTFSFNLDSGSTTTLGFVGRNAYTVLIEPDPYAQEADNVA